MKICKVIVGLLLRILFILGVPFLVVYFFVYRPLNYNFCTSTPASSYLGTDGSPAISDVEQKISNGLEQTNDEIQFFNPILPINESWLRFDVFLKNNLRVALVVTEPKSYTEATTTFYVQTQFGSPTVPFSQNAKIAQKIKSDQLDNLIVAWGFITNNKPIEVGPHQWVSLQTNPNLGQICVIIKLHWEYGFLIYLEYWIVWVGLLILFREMLKFWIEGFFSYFIKSN